MKNYKNVALLLGILVLAVLFTSACNATADEGNFPTGKFRLSDDKFTGFNFNEDGSWNAVSLGEVIAEGKYKVDGDLYIEQTNDQGCTAPMSYQYSFDGTNLKFQLTEESAADTTCTSRKQGFDNMTYVLAK